MKHEVPTSVLAELASAASEQPDDCLITVDDVEYSYASVYQRVVETARGLRQLGIERGDRVLILLPNCAEAVSAWLGVQAAGAVDVPVSVEATGASLRHVVIDVEPRAVIATSELYQTLKASVPEHDFEIAVIVGSSQAEAPVVDTTGLEGWGHLLALGRSSTEELPVAKPEELATIMFTSGSSGPPKGVMLPHGYYAHIASVHMEPGVLPLKSGQVMYCTQPLCHIDPRVCFLDVLFLRGSMVLASRFSASRYWDDVERYDADAFVFIGAMLPLLFKQPARPSGRRRIGLGAAIPAAIHQEFCERFNVDLLEGYGMTEVYAVLMQRAGQGTPGDVGRPLPGVEVEVVDSEGWPLPDGVAGELVVRPTRPYVVMTGYWRRPEATVEAWRGLWMHTGDLARRLADGRIEYAGRLKDSIRRRGENVSCWEVEHIAATHPQVLEAAAIGIPSPLGEEDVALVIVPHPDGAPEPGQLRSFMAADLPRYALPRFIDIVPSLPKTPSERVAKAVLKQRGLSPNVYDAELRAF